MRSQMGPPSNNTRNFGVLVLLPFLLAFSCIIPSALQPFFLFIYLSFVFKYPIVLFFIHVPVLLHAALCCVACMFTWMHVAADPENSRGVREYIHEVFKKLKILFLGGKENITKILKNYKKNFV